MKRTAFVSALRRKAFYAALAILVPSAAMADEQIGFSARNTGQGREYSYQLRNEYTEAVSRVVFTLRKSDLDDPAQGLQAPQDIARAAQPKVVARGNERCADLARKYNDLASCKVSPASNGTFQINQRFRKGVDRAAVERDVQRILNELTAYSDQLMAGGAYTIKRTSNGRGTISVDYAGIAKRAVPAMAPVAKAVKRADIAIAGTTSAKRIALSRAIVFLQAIPYDTLESSQRATGMGYLPPLALIDENRGDCDSKAVAYAAMARTLAPGMPVAIIIVPGHALVGLGVSPEPGDVTLMSGGLTYVLAEPVGPAPGRIGEIGPLSKAGLKNTARVEVIRVF